MLHPQTRALLQLIEQRGEPPMHSLSVAAARTGYRERRSVTQPPPPDVASIEDLWAEAPHGAIGLRLYRPLGAAARTALPVAG
jgi:acetyl esterase